jgi:hypothetical protein
MLLADAAEDADAIDPAMTTTRITVHRVTSPFCP